MTSGTISTRLRISRLLKKSPVDARQGGKQRASATDTLPNEHLEPLSNAPRRRPRFSRQPASIGILLLTLAGIWLSAAAADGDSFTLDKLAALLSGVQQSQAAFVETKTMALLDRPLRLQGKLYFRAPDYVRKEVTAPEHEDYEITGDVVRIQSGDGDTRVLNLDRHPALRAFAEAFRATLRGDLDQLRRFYDLQLSGTAEDWLLRLTPRDAAMAAHVARIEVSGSNAQLFSVLIQETDGDQSLMRIRSVGE